MSSSKRKLVISKADILQVKKSRQESSTKQVTHQLNDNNNLNQPTKSSLKKINDNNNDQLNSTIDDEPLPSTSLPAGFFDDPVKDASARSVAYVDPDEKEWSDFQKIISTESIKADDLLETELIELQKERNLIEIDTQIDNWSRVEALNKRLEQVKEKKKQLNQQPASSSSSVEKKVFTSQVNEDETNDSDSGEDMDDLLNWRAKCKLR